MNPEEFMDQDRDMEFFFEMEQIENPKRVKMTCMKLKGNAFLWWDTMQLERKREGKDKIRNWDQMVAKLKGKFLTVDYTLNLYKKLQNLRQKEMTIKEQTKEFFRISIISGDSDGGEEVMVRYIN